MIRVLIAEDQEIIRQSLEMMLQTKANINIVGTAKDGKETIEKVIKHTPDVVLLDIRMPKMDGVQCCKIIKDKVPSSKVIILTTFDDDEYVFNAIKNGASGYLLKGISLEELVKAIETVASGGALMNPNVTARVVEYFSQMANANYTQKVEEDYFEELSQNELRIMQMVGMGMSNKEITEVLHFSEGTVRNYISNILNKLDLRDRTQIAILAVQSGLTMKIIE